jgi:hypothetical protein
LLTAESVHENIIFSFEKQIIFLNEKEKALPHSGKVRQGF